MQLSTRFVQAARFSPFTDEIACICESRQIRMISIDGSSDSLLFSVATFGGVAISPDGTSIAFIDSGDLYTGGTDGTNRTTALSSAGLYYVADWVGTPSNCIAQRVLPDYVAGSANEVAIDVTPAHGTSTYALEETPPSGWAVWGISDGGQWDSANSRVEWGPFLDAQVRTLTYSVAPPSGTSGTATFAGVLSIDGEDEEICGDTTVEYEIPPCTFGPEGQPLVFTRERGKPTTETVTWSSCGGEGELVVSVDRISSAWVWLNGQMVVQPLDLNQGVDELLIEVVLAEGENVLEVELHGKPGGALVLEFMQ